jgi:excisionase family DNA binding protein
MTVPELAAYLRISRNAAYALCRRPDFPVTRIGGQIRVYFEALRQWLSTRH